MRKAWAASPRLSASENSRGWALLADGQRVGEIYPQAPDPTPEARAYAAFIPTACNCHDDLLYALKLARTAIGVALDDRRGGPIQAVLREVEPIVKAAVAKAEAIAALAGPANA